MYICMLHNLIWTSALCSSTVRAHFGKTRLSGEAKSIRKRFAGSVKASIFGLISDQQMGPRYSQVAIFFGSVERPSILGIIRDDEYWKWAFWEWFSDESLLFSRVGFPNFSSFCFGRKHEVNHSKPNRRGLACWLSTLPWWLRFGRPEACGNRDLQTDNLLNGFL